MSQDAKPLSAAGLVPIRGWVEEGQSLTAAIGSDLLATIDRLNAQLATARNGLEKVKITVHAPSCHGRCSDYCPVLIADAALAAIDRGADGAEPSWEDAAMKGQSNVAFKAVVESANNALIAFDRFIEERHDGVDFVYEQIGGPMEELRGVLCGTEPKESEA